MFSHLILCLVGRAEAGELKAAAGWVLIQHWYYFTVKESLSGLSLWTVEERNVSMNSTVWFIKNWLFGIVGRVHRHPTAPLFDEVGMTLKYQLFFTNRTFNIGFAWEKMLVFAEFSPTDRESLQDPAVCPCRVTSPMIHRQSSVMNLDPHTQSKKLFLL